MLELLNKGEYMKFWLSDPKDKNGSPSVSLTLLMVTFSLTLIAAGLQMFKIVDNISCLPEVLWGLLSLYFLRRFSIGGKTFSSDQAEQIVNKIDSEVK
jgi:hypothetical protein